LVVVMIWVIVSSTGGCVSEDWISDVVVAPSEVRVLVVDEGPWLGVDGVVDGVSGGSVVVVVVGVLGGGVVEVDEGGFVVRVLASSSPVLVRCRFSRAASWISIMPSAEKAWANDHIESVAKRS
jgi:hypothetical protein